MDGGVEDATENEGVMRQDRHAHQVAEPVLEGAGQVVLDPGVAQMQDRRGADRRRGLGTFFRLGISPDLLEDRGFQDVLGHLGHVQGLQQEGADLLRALEAEIPGPGQIQLLAGPGHGHIEEAALLLDVVPFAGQALFEEAVRDRDPLPLLAAGETVLDQADQEDRPELEPLGLVDRQDVDRVLVEVRLGSGRVIADLEEQVQISRERPDGIVLDQVREALDLVEEQSEVLDARLGLERQRLDEGFEIAGPLQERIDDRPGVLGRREVGEEQEIVEDPLDGLPGRPGDLDRALAFGDGLEHAMER